MRPFYVGDRMVLNLDQVAWWAKRVRRDDGSKPQEVLEVSTADRQKHTLYGTQIEEFKKEIDTMVNQARLR